VLASDVGVNCHGHGDGGSDCGRHLGVGRAGWHGDSTVNGVRGEADLAADRDVKAVEKIEVIKLFKK
jgi:hypothetical protein